MRHPGNQQVPGLAPILVGEVWDNPVRGERGRWLELPWQNPQGRAVGEMTARPGARVVGEHRHPIMVERFTVLSGELTVRLDGVTSVLEEGATSEVRPGRWHDWWNASDDDVLVLVEATPGERFMHSVETLFGLSRLGYTNDKGVPGLLQLAMMGREFSDMVQFRKPPPVLQRMLFAVLGAVAGPLGYRGTYPELSRSVDAPRYPARGSAS